MKSFVMAALLMAGIAHADQIEREDREITNSAPAAVMVKINAEDKTVTVYQVPEMEAALKADRNQLEKMSALFEVESNKIGEFAVSKNELDNDGSSTPAWWGRWCGGGWGWRNWGGWNRGYNWHRPYYRPGHFHWNNYGYHHRHHHGHNHCNYGWYW